MSWELSSSWGGHCEKYHQTRKVKELRWQRPELHQLPLEKRAASSRRHILGNSNGLSCLVSTRKACHHSGRPCTQLLHAELQRHSPATGKRSFYCSHCLYHFSVTRLAHQDESCTSCRLATTLEITQQLRESLQVSCSRLSSACSNDAVDKSLARCCDRSR